MKAKSNRRGGQRLWVLPVLLIGSFLVLAWSTEAQYEKGAQNDAHWLKPQWQCRTEPFETNSAKLSEGQIDCLKIASDQLRNLYQGYLVVIDGHRDPSERKGISQSRVNEARDYLIQNESLEAKSIFVRNFCDSCPIGFKDNPNNRRIEIGIVPPGSSLPADSTVYKCTISKPEYCDEKETGDILKY